MTTDTIADVLTRVRNAQLAGHKIVKVPVSKLATSVLNVLQIEGFIESFEAAKNEETTFSQYSVFLKYYDNGIPVISQAHRVSKPGCRNYSGVDGLTRVSNGLGISIISTSQGVMSDREARKRQIGGEVLAYIA